MVFTELRGAGFAVVVCAVVVINLSKSVTAVAASVVAGIGPSVAAARSVSGRARAVVLLGADAGAMAIGDVCMLIAFSLGGGAMVAVIINCWPVVAAVLLARFMPGFQNVTWLSASSATLALIGGAVVVFGTQEANSVAPLAVGWAITGVVFEACTVVLHQRFLVEIGAGTAAQPLWQAMRSATAALLAAIGLPALWLLGTDPIVLPTLTVVELGAAGLLWTISALLFHRGVSASENPFVTVPWLVSPLVAALLVAHKTEQVLPISVVLGGVTVLSTNALISTRPRRCGPGPAAVIASTALAACAVFTVDGRNIVSAGPGIAIATAGFAMGCGLLSRGSRLPAGHGSRSEKRHDLDAGTWSAAVMNCSARRDYWALGLRSSVGGAAVTVVGLGLVTAVVYCRPRGCLVDAMAVVLVSATLAAIVLMWSARHRGSLPRREGIAGELRSAPARTRALAGAAVAGACASIVATALAGPVGWPRL
ncbi:hypothetical protein [Nocardia sp. NPDC052566]|uniref:hypothetical protein n=1 Tax=Nocardia sp. NPDC052566 TaxID=3364330 RepID=UPI0037C770D0